MNAQLESVRPLAREDILTQYLGDGSVVLFDPASSVAHELNVTGALVWDCCDGRHSFAQIVSVLEDCFGGTADYRPDVAYFLALLEKLAVLIEAR